MLLNEISVHRSPTETANKRSDGVLWSFAVTKCSSEHKTIGHKVFLEDAQNTDGARDSRRMFTRAHSNKRLSGSMQFQIKTRPRINTPEKHMAIQNGTETESIFRLSESTLFSGIIIEILFTNGSN
jgi:hypothetical protein